jgi:AMME syndrome candidate gene 1 protein
VETAINNNNNSINNNNASFEQLQATASMCHYCFDVLVTELRASSHRKGRNHHSTFIALQQHQQQSDNNSSTVVAPPDFVHALPHETVECPLFVTWDKRKEQQQHHRRLSCSGGGSEDHFELRGCIGTLSPKPLATSIGEYALISALRDRRFDPVSLHEIPHLRVAVSLLVLYEDCDHVHDWSVGIHGIMIRWLDDEGGVEYSATYLPEVASEQGWDQHTAVSSLIRKAGYHGRITKDLLGQIQCTRYQSSKHRVSFDEYIEQGGHDPATVLETDSSHQNGSRGSARSSSPGNCIVS